MRRAERRKPHREDGRRAAVVPALFPKFADTLIGANDDIVKPAETDTLDREVELVVAIGRGVHRAFLDEAVDAIAGFTVTNDVSVRDWQFRIIEWAHANSGPVLASATVATLV
ncbi:fumarylacetoacetate hydrolase family protein [Rhodococcus opacus]|uniref:fumarylacetoacetate hydrolase family protein n=1 Tax=Rhodococcus opacus TaxID=37919 RepID=UPI00211ECB74|nr:fumarylacetoacetate hydrolase family protein [Rhodococcus opacus]